MMRSAVPRVQKPLFRRGWFIALVVTLTIIIWGVSLSYASDQGGEPTPGPSNGTATAPAIAAPALPVPSVALGSVAPGALAADQGWSLHLYAIRPNSAGYFTATITVANDTGTVRSGRFTLTVIRAGYEVATLSGTVSAVAAHQTATVPMVSSTLFLPGPFTVKFRSYSS